MLTKQNFTFTARHILTSKSYTWYNYSRLFYLPFFFSFLLSYVFVTFFCHYLLLPLFSFIFHPAFTIYKFLMLYFSHSLSNTHIRAGPPRGRSSNSGRDKIFLFSVSSMQALGSTEPLNQWLPGLKRPGRETNYSAPTSVEVKKKWVYTSTPHTLS
jgi:hypothetical protein